MLNALKKAARRLLKPPLHAPDLSAPCEMLGSAYGGWPLLTRETPRGATILSFGLGEDISFDLAAIARFGCVVHGFDPTPKSVAWMAEQDLPAGFRFHPVGVAARDGEAEFFAPAVEAYASFSLAPDPSRAGVASVTAPVLRLETIVARFLDAPPEIVKMDIEGFEYEVIDDLLAGPLRPRQLLVEFHHGLYGVPKERTRRAVDRLRAAGYRLFHVSPTGREYGFLLPDQPPAA